MRVWEAWSSLLFWGFLEYLPLLALRSCQTTVSDRHPALHGRGKFAVRPGPRCTLTSAFKAGAAQKVAPEPGSLGALAFSPGKGGEAVSKFFLIRHGVARQGRRRLRPSPSPNLFPIADAAAAGGQPQQPPWRRHDKPRNYIQSLPVRSDES
ncbi:hypothetical protein FA95DRAFT_604164 [Auriscalpium vulgare]|uniref:Uncharacterized protein n=1 Tax=Auriscalpium vulgare TaxID=40419 RepID=A0ACB8S355_9AGAM|nr:hypothetical protein FA95DRAFT_604164 [Auriscalpium vulgare]